jgi:peptide/nickel transport system substrate-binding protein
MLTVPVVACGPPAPVPGAPRPLTLTVGVPQSRGLGPTRQLASYAFGLFTDRLTSSDTQGRPVRRLVDGWSQSADGLTWRLSVRAGVRFADGTPLTNMDVSDAIRRLASRPDPASGTVCLADIRDVSADNPGGVAIRLARPCYYLLDELVVDIQHETADGTRVGTAPYRLVLSSDDEVVLEANPFYYLGRPAIDRVVVRAYETLRTAWGAMLRGQCDFLSEVGPESFEFLRDQSGVVTRSFEGLNCLAIVFNSTRPAFRDATVRRALNMAINRAELVEAGLRGQGWPADIPVSPSFWAVDPAAPQIPFDAERARALLARPHPLTFTCLLPDNYSLFERVALLAQRQLRAVDVDMRLEVVPPAEFIARVGRGEFEAALFNPLGGPSAAFFHRLWHSPDPNPRWNSFGYRDGAVDSALDAMRSSVTDDQFRAAMSRFVAALREDPPAICLVWPTTNQAVSRRFVLPLEAAGRDGMGTVAAWQLREGDR